MVSKSAKCVDYSSASLRPFYGVCGVPWCLGTPTFYIAINVFHILHHVWCALTIFIVENAFYC